MTLDFNDNWTFCREGETSFPITLPHDAMRQEPRDGSLPGGETNGYFPGGVYVYEKRFTLPAETLRASAVLHFEGVYRNSTVTVNGKLVCAHRNGFTPFDADISDAVQAGENTVSVRVDNSLLPNCRWYTGSGIYRPVTLLVRDKAHILTLRVCTVSLDPAVIEVETDADTVEVYDGERLVASGTPGELTIPRAKLWSAETPYRYTLVAKSKTDERRLRFGIRTLTWSAQKGLLVNGRAVKLRGGCIHHDHGILGAAEYAEAERRRVRILKEQGFNAIRTAHNPASCALLDACDEFGVYVMDEAFDGWYTPKTYHDYARDFDAHWRDDLAATVETAYNHPCVILYSIGNEVSETAAAKGVALCAAMRDEMHRLDPTRPVTAGINVLLDVYARLGIGVYRDKGDYRPEPLPKGRAYREKKTGSAFFNYWAEKLGWLFFVMSKGRLAERVTGDIAPALDVLGYNYASSRYDIDAAKHPERLTVGSETMAGDLAYNWARVQQYPQLIGDFVWAAWDYLGECCMGWTYQSYPGLPLFANQGMIDGTGLPLASMAYLQTVWGLRKSPYIGVRPLNHAHETPSKGAWQFTDALESWTWHGFEGVMATVEVYTKAPRVRLLLNGKAVGTAKTKAYKAIFRVPYTPGTLTAEALDENGTVLSCASLSTGGREKAITIRREQAAVHAGEVFFVPVELTDRQGILQPYREEPVSMEADNAELLGFGSALYKTNEDFLTPTHTAYRGRVLAVFRAGEAGTVTVTATAADGQTTTQTWEATA